MGLVRANVTLVGDKGSRSVTALVDTGAAITVVDKALAEEVGVTYTGRRRALITASGHRVEGEVGIVKELVIEGETLDYERVLVLELSEVVKETLRSAGVSDSVIVGLTTIEAAGLVPNTATGRLRKTETFLFPIY